jgi:Mrp family chromosome partitioning ATPase
MEDVMSSAEWTPRKATPGELAALEQAAEPVMIYHGRCTIDCGEHGHQDVEMLKMIPAGSKLYTHPARKPMTREDMRKLTKEHFGSYDLTGADFALIRAVERFHKIEE